MEPITDENIRHLVKRYIRGNSGLPHINTWNVSNVTNMSGLFADALRFNEPLNNWNVSNVTNMKNMFYTALQFNQPLDSWNVSNVTNMEDMFSNTSKFNQPLNYWTVFNVINMAGLFYNATQFNQPLNNWNVSNVTNMQQMFLNAISFNQPLDSWDVSNVINMEEMFLGAIKFEPINAPWYTFSRSRSNSDSSSDELSDEFDEQLSLPALAEEVYTQLSPLPLTNSPKTINLTNSSYDAISMEEIQFSDFLTQDVANIIIEYDRNIYFANKNSIRYLVLDGSSIKYGCKQVATTLIPRRENLFDEPCFNMNSIGIISGLVYLNKIKTILENDTLRVFEIPSEPIANYVSTASLQMLSSLPIAVGASHCQAGQAANVFDIKNVPYESRGGKRKKMKKTRKIKKTGKTKKTGKMKQRKSKKR
jgi:surface protein